MVADIWCRDFWARRDQRGGGHDCVSSQQQQQRCLTLLKSPVLRTFCSIYCMIQTPPRLDSANVVQLISVHQISPITQRATLDAALVKPDS